MPKRAKLEWKRVGECIVVTSHKAKAGYIRMSRGSSQFYLHRVVCERRHGKLPKNTEALHSCDNGLCINPDHLRPGTHRENMDDAVSRSRMARQSGVKNGFAKLTETKAMEIFISKGKNTEIAKKFGVSKSVVGRIKKRSAWSHIHLEKCLN